jgi:hypothetical protein
MGDLIEAQLAEEAQCDDLAIRLVESADCRSDPGGTLQSQGADRRIQPSRQVDTGRRVRRVDPGHVATALGSAESDADGNPRQPRTEGSVMPPPCEALEGGHEGFLGCVLGLLEIAEDAMAGANDSGRFMIDEDPERIAIASQDSIDNGALIDDLGVCGRGWKR